MEKMTYQKEPEISFEAGEKEPIEQKTMHFIDKGDCKECSLCGAEMRGWAYREKFNYCPMCGAKAE